MGTSVIVKSRYIDEKIREGKTIRTTKEMVGLYYLAHIYYFLFLNKCLWLVPVIYMVYRL